ncbi:MAG TPA: tetratricopeptide repeat protein, partial [Actinomycetospora sp.]|nr:tetratricopeptide repeat protein [Actinomycetospora sp.]
EEPERDRHPDTLRCRVGLLEAMRCSGDLDAAAAAAPGLVADLVAVAGEDAVATMRAREELVRLTWTRGDDAHARRMARELLGRRRRVLGDDHPHTARSRLLVEAELRPPSSGAQ